MQGEKYGAELIVYGEKIRKFREDKGMTQYELAERSGVSRIQIARIEKMQMIPSLSTAIKIGLALEVTVNDFLVYDQKIINKRREMGHVNCCEAADIDQIIEIIATTLKFYQRKAEVCENNIEKKL